jgi:NAD(P)-dependent dehydrogenase (short-subunit alcohol dehydrogenase family)/acyl dehydratase/putative sterol carrier protein
VVVNDLGGSMTGEGAGSSRAADKVVEEIRSAGGQAVANYDSVTDGAKVIKTAIDAYGRVDILVNNAGILRDVSFQKMTDRDWELLYQVHLRGTYSVTKAAWPHMMANKFGRIIMVTSAAGLYGNFGQAHYSAVKMGVVGLANTLAKEGEKSNIRVNTIAPLAGSRMTETILPPDLVKALAPEYVVPLVEYLCHESTTESGSVFEVGAGWISKVRWERSQGVFFSPDPSFTPEALAREFAKVGDFSQATYPTSGRDAFEPIMKNLERAKSGSAKPAAKGAEKASNVDVKAVMAYRMEPMPYTYTDREVILYALAIGAATDQLDPKELRFTYENASDFQVFPTFGVIPPSAVLGNIMSIPGMSFNPMMLVHGEQYLEVKRPIPTSGTLTSHAKVAGLYDKGKGALLMLDVVTKDEKGQDVFFNQYSLFIRGLGGFGGDKGPKPVSYDPPARPPDVVHREKTSDNQALLYRLCGDRNPLHADPAMAKMGNFDKPILHGLCSFGYAARAVLKHYADNDSSKFKSINVRFSSPVFPGETLITEMWRVSPTTIVFRVKVAERGEYVLSNCAITLVGEAAAAAAAPAAVPAPAASATPAPAAAGGKFKATAVFAELAKRITPEVISKVNGSYRFDLTNAAGEKKSWVVDLKKGGIRESTDNADCIIIMSDDDFIPLMQGKLNAQKAFMEGKVKLKGNMMLAQKLSVLTAQKASL